MGADFLVGVGDGSKLIQRLQMCHVAYPGTAFLAYSLENPTCLYGFCGPVLDLGSVIHKDFKVLVQWPTTCLLYFSSTAFMSSSFSSAFNEALSPLNKKLFGRTETLVWRWEELVFFRCS
ncbi:hypothetical protein NC651_037187 [Populus alba x Populus x berolinensis]|nr:hypothetical protein NC651_037187 [Populus alba x Populus x berolinensis]